MKYVALACKKKKSFLLSNETLWAPGAAPPMCGRRDRPGQKTIFAYKFLKKAKTARVRILIARVRFFLSSIRPG